MAQAPYARLLVSVNGRGPFRGGVEVHFGDTIELYAESTIGWGVPAAVWEITSYPLGWSPPPAWTLDTVTRAYALTGNLSSLPPFPLPAATSGLWGKWRLRLRVNGGGGTLTDWSTSLEIVSPHGLHDLAMSEGDEFGAERSWVGPHQRNLRRLEAELAEGTANNVKLGEATDQATPNTLVLRDAAGAAAFNSLTSQSGYVVTADGEFALSQLVAAKGAGAPATLRAQQGAPGEAGGSLTIGGGDAGTTATGQAAPRAGSTLVELGTPDPTSTLSAEFELLAGAAGAFLVMRSAKGAANLIARRALLWQVGASEVTLDAAGLALAIPAATMGNARAAPTANPVEAVSLYAFAGGLFARSLNGLVTTLAPAGDAGGTVRVNDRIDATTTTKDATPVVLVTYPLPLASTGQLTLDITVQAQNAAPRGWFSRKYRVSRIQGDVQIQPANQVVLPDDDTTGGTVAAQSAAANINVMVTGVAATTLQWRASGAIEIYAP